jgi:exodeoxyribonuclease V gamma subunit
MLHIHTAGDFDLLAQQFLTINKTIQKPLLARSAVVVPNMAIGRWLSQQLAAAEGISANFERVLPAEYVWRLKRQLSYNIPHQSDFDVPVLVYRILAVFEDISFCVRHSRLNNYLEDCDQAGRLQLASRVARTFENYQLYRDEWLSSWSAGELQQLGDDEAWQQALWQRLCNESEQSSRNLLERELVIAIEAGAGALQLPKALCVFGLNHVSPGFVKVLKALATQIEVHLFNFSPTAENVTPELPHWQSLVTNVQQAFSEVKTCPVEIEATNPKRASRLHNMQSALKGCDVLPCVDDTSLIIASCFSPMREVEALHDYLMRRCAEDDSLHPGDILVAMPDLETYTPYIRAVFEGGDRSIPYQFADSQAATESALISGLQALLDVVNWRFTREQVEVLLRNRLIQCHFTLTDTELEQIHVWLDIAAVRWGVDGVHRAELGLPASDKHTWRAGLDRLLLGFALPKALGGTAPLYGDAEILPVDEVESGSVDVLSRFVSYCDSLFALRVRLQKQRTIGEWQDLLRSLLNDFFTVDEQEEGILQRLLQIIDKLGSDAIQAGYSANLDVSSIAALFEANIPSISSDGCLSGCVNFAKMGSLSGLPFKQICLLGMDYEHWPTRQREPGFDLIKAYPQTGDRQNSLLERHQTLQLILAAKDALYLSYTGYNIGNGDKRPASVLVSELEYLAERLNQPIAITRHPMHPYSTGNFIPSLLHSHSTHWCDTAAQLNTGEGGLPPLCVSPIPFDQPESISIDELQQFFASPQKSFLRNGLGLYLRDESDQWDNSEPFDLSGFVDGRVRETILEQRIAGVDKSLALNKAAGVLPHGMHGDLLHELEESKVDDLLGSANDQFKQPRLEPRYVSIELEATLDHEDKKSHAITLSGMLNDVSTTGIHLLMSDKLFDYQKVRIWLNHLLLCCAKFEGVACSTQVLSLDGAWVLSEPEDAKALLSEWLSAFLVGQQKPLPFFPKSSRAYAQSLLTNPDETGKAEAAFKKNWRDGFNFPGEGSKLANQYIYRDYEPLDNEFSDWAERLYFPMFDHESDELIDELVDEPSATDDGSLVNE